MKFMGITQDKQIREKLNSLDTLPEGYAPSLDSKWELLMAGQPEVKKQTPYFWFAAAASIVLLLGFGFLFLKNSTTPNPMEIAGKTAPAFEQKTVPFLVEKPGTQKTLEKPEIVATQTETTVKKT